ncbi:MAG: hypothetical protein ABJM06_14995 [Gilvibacter sp.]
MRKTVFILLLAFMLLNCETKKDNAGIEKVEFFYPRIPKINDNVKKGRIYLDSIQNFGELNILADQIVCDKKWPILIFETENNKYNFALFKECTVSMDIVDYHGSNVIYIEKDSIIINQQNIVPFDSLENILTKHILNPNREFDYSKSIEKALIFYYQDSLFESKKIKNQLIKISSVFNELNSKNGDSLPLKIKLNEHPFINVLPPTLPNEN